MDQATAGTLDVAVAVDIGGTTTRVALVQLASAQARQWERVATFPTEPGYTAQVARVAEAVHMATQLARRQHAGKRPMGVGVSLGGRIAPDGSGVSVAPNLRDYEGRPFVQKLSAACDEMPVRLAHDAVCGLLAERRFGALQGDERCAYLTLSTGTGCATHVQSPGSAMGVTTSIELGHQLLDGNTRLCLCGQTGCLETYTGGRQLELRYGKPIEALPDHPLWDELVDKLSLGVVNLAHLTRIERVALGGAIALNRPGLLDALRAAVASRLRGAQVEIGLAELGESAPLIGAATLLMTPADEIVS